MEVTSSHSSKDKMQTSISVTYDVDDAMASVTIKSVIVGGDVIKSESYIASSAELHVLKLLIEAVKQLITAKTSIDRFETGSVLGKLQPYIEEPFDVYPYFEVGEFYLNLVRVELKYDDPEIDNDFYTAKMINGISIDLSVTEATLFIQYLDTVIPILLENEVK